MFLPSQIANSLKNTSQTIRSDSKQGLTYSNVSKTSCDFTRELPVSESVVITKTVFYVNDC